MMEQIQTLLNELEENRGLDILYACESGSRAWGFASPDSDYDIRFLYRRPIKECYLVTAPSDTIEIPIKDDLDPGGWELRKALGLLAKSNGALIEWLHSPIVYRTNDAFLGEMRDLATQHLCRRGLANHYRGMAHQSVEAGLKKNAPTGKAYLYALRATLCARHVLKMGTPPPVVFDDLLHDLEIEHRQAVDELLEWKKNAGEKDSPGRIPLLDRFVTESLADLGKACEALPPKSPAKDPFNDMLHRWTLWPS